MIQSESGRIFYKHHSGKGCVMCFQRFGIPSRVFVFHSDYQKYINLPVNDNTFLKNIRFPPTCLSDSGIDRIFPLDITECNFKEDIPYLNTLELEGLKPVVPPIDILFRLVAENRILRMFEDSNESFLTTKSFVSNEIDYASSTYYSYNEVWCLNRKVLYKENVEDDKVLIRPIIFL